MRCRQHRLLHAHLLELGDPLLLLVELLVDVCEVLGPIELLVADDVELAARLLLVPVGAARLELESLRQEMPPRLDLAPGKLILAEVALVLVLLAAVS